jgi:Holliday junction resolvasome RuvABC endonuclease subunit
MLLSPSKLKSYEGGGMRYARLEDKLNSLGSVDRVGYEAVRAHAGTAAAHSYGGYKAIIMKWCEKEEPKIPYCVFPVQTIKIRATGKGNASKDLVKKAALATFGVEVSTDDESDALWILALMCDDVGIEL